MSTRLKIMSNKIIHVMDELVWGGVNSFVRDLCQELKAIGFDVNVIILMDQRGDFDEFVEKLGYEGINIINLGANNKEDALLRYIPVLRKKIIEISDGELTICNFHLRLSTLMGAVSTIGLKNIIRVETYHSAYKNYTLQNHFLRPLIDRYVPCSKSAGEEMKTRFGVKEHQMSVIPNGVSRSSLRSTVKKQYEETEVIHALSVGRFTNQKNFTVTANAFKELCSERLIYRIIGEGNEFEAVKSIASDNQFFELPGNQTRTEVLENLNEADIVIMPSLWEGLSIFMLESLAFDNPMIISEADSLLNVFGEKKLNDNEEYRLCGWGYICKTNEPDSYKQALIHFRDHRELWKGMREKIREYSIQYDVKESANKYSILYNALLKERQTGSQ